ncbi:MAG: protease modulator HflK [Verrucomicrobiota bacterium]
MMPEDAGSQALADALRSSFAIVRVIMIILVVVFFASGVFTVPSQEKAIVLRFGRPVGSGEEQLLGPGLHWSFPYPIDEVVRIPISQIQIVTSTAGWYATTPEAEQTNSEPDAGPSLNPAEDGYAMTGDGNIIHLRVTLRYRINNPINYTLNFVNASNVVQNALDSALIHSAAQFTVDDALRLAVVELREKIIARVRQSVEEQGVGISIEEAFLQTIPPRQVKQAFADVIAADQDRGKAINEAQAYASRVRNGAVGEAKTLVNAGRTEGERLLQSAAADAKYFGDQLPHYQRDPQLFVARLQTETLQRILTNAQEKILRLDAGERPMWIHLNREPVKPTSQSQTPPR